MLNVSTVDLSATPNDTPIIELTTERLAILEECSSISIFDKVNILALLLQRKWLADIAIGDADNKNVIACLDNLSLYWSRQKQNDGDTEWLLASTTKAAIDYVEHRANHLSDIEAGVLYGLPATHTLAFSSIIPRLSTPKRQKSIAEFFFTGVYSNKYNISEQAHAQETWRLIELTSPKIANEAKRARERLKT